MEKRSQLYEKENKGAITTLNKMKREVRSARVAVDKSLRRLPNNLKHAQEHGYESELMEFVDALQDASNILRKVE